MAEQLASTPVKAAAVFLEEAATPFLHLMFATLSGSAATASPLEELNNVPASVQTSERL